MRLAEREACQVQIATEKRARDGVLEQLAECKSRLQDAEYQNQQWREKFANVPNEVEKCNQERQEI